MTKTELLAQIEAKRVEVAEKLELARLSGKLKTMEASMVIERQEASTGKLADLDKMCEEITASMPIFNSKTRENRKWRPSKVYNLGKHVEYITGLCSGIQYSAAEHKAQMLLATGLSEDLIEEVVESMGSTAYFNKNYNVIVEETPYNYNRLIAALDVIADRLELDANFAGLTEQSMAHRFERARINADLAKAQSEVELATATAIDAKIDQTITVE